MPCASSRSRLAITCKFDTRHLTKLKNPLELRLEAASKAAVRYL